MFGEILQELRKDKGWKQSDLAEMLGLSKSAVGSYESGVSEPSFDNLVKISDLFNVNIDYLLGHIRDSTSWLDMSTEIKLDTGSIKLSDINETILSMELHNRTAIIEHMMNLKKLEHLETSIRKISST